MNFLNHPNTWQAFVAIANTRSNFKLKISFTKSRISCLNLCTSMEHAHPSYHTTSMECGHIQYAFNEIVPISQHKKFNDFNMSLGD
jgi:Zn-dependent M28 family amino/carboxypeptidase